MPDIRLIASDMDGTLLDAQGRISPRTLSALRKAQEKGVIFTMCTGRFHTHCCALARDVGLNCSIIASNGGSGFDGWISRFTRCFCLNSRIRKCGSAHARSCSRCPVRILQPRAG